MPVKQCCTYRPVSYKHSQWRGQRCQYHTNTHREGVKDASIIQTLTVKGVKDASIIQTLTVKGSKMPVSYKHSQWRGQRCQYNTNTHSEGVKYASIIHSQWRGQICQYHTNTHSEGVKYASGTGAGVICGVHLPLCQFPHQPRLDAAEKHLVVTSLWPNLHSADSHQQHAPT